jgi:putative heme-binding domain-containing protein
LPRLDQLSVEALTEALASPDPWRRQVAQRLLVERQDRSSLNALRRLTTTTDNPLARLHALWTLQGMRSLDEALVIASLEDPHPALRENALQLAERHLPGSRALRNAIVARATDESARVRFQAALTLGQVEEAAATAALRRILERDYQHRWSRLAVLSSLASGEREWLEHVTGPNPFTGQAAIELMGELADLAGARCVAEDAASWAEFFGSASVKRLTEERLLAVLRGWQSGLNRAGIQWHDASALQSALEALAGTATLPVQTEIWRTQRLLGMEDSEAQRRAVAVSIKEALDRSRPVNRRSAAARLCVLGRAEQVVDALLPLLSSTEPIEVQEAVFDTLQQFPELSVAEGLIQRWRFTSPWLRPRAVAVLLQRRPYHGLVLDAIEDGRLRLGELNLDLEQRRRLLRWSTPAVHARAARLIGDGEYGNRQANVDDWLKKLPEHGNPANGRALFELACASCHRVGELGHEVGPNLTGLAHRSVEDLVSHVLDPNMSIEPAYVAYDVETTEGELLTGILESEGADSIALLMASSVRHVIPRDRIVRVESTGLSLMAERLEDGMSPQDLRDLIAFLQERR